MVDLAILLDPSHMTSDEEGVALVGLVGPIATESANEGPSELAAALRGSISTMAPSLVSASLDWWCKVELGEVASSHCYQLPDEFRSPFRESVEALRDVHTSVTPARWRRAIDELEAGRSELRPEAAGPLDLDSYGKSKLPEERTAWDALLEELSSSIESLRAGQPGPEIDEVDETFVKILSTTTIQRNSRRWDEMVRRAGELVARLQVIRDAAVIVAGHAGAAPARVDEVPPNLREGLGPVADVVFASILRDPEEGRPAARLAADLDRFASTLQPQDLNRIAALLRPWVEAHRVTIGALDQPIRMLREIEDAERELEAAGADVDAIGVERLDGRFSEALELVRELHGQMEHQLAGRRLHREVQSVRRRFESAGITPDADLGALEAELDGLVGDGRVREAETRLGAVAARFTDLLDQDRSQRARDLVGRLEDLGAPREQILDIGKAIDAAPPTAARITELEEEVERLRAALLREAAAIRERILSDIEDDERDDGDLDADTAAEFRRRVGVVATEDDPDEEIRRQVNALRALEAELGRLKVRRWRPGRDTEAQLVSHLIGFCTERIDYAEKDLRRLYAALKTKPFVILSGLTGSGKSSIVRLVAEALGATQGNGQYRRVAVRPDWIDQSEVLGYINPLSGRFEPGWLADVVRSCQAQPNKLHFVLLDEMNLAPVEQYLAEFLSAMESARAGFDDVVIPLYTRGASPANSEEWPAELRFPANLFMVGTVNVDETTRPLSDRVIDRANVLQLDMVWSRRHHEPPGERLTQPWVVDADAWATLVETVPADDHHDLLVDIARGVEAAGIGVGLRAHVELERFLANAEHVLDPIEALDMGILQRIVPKIRGFKRELEPALSTMHGLLVPIGCVNTIALLDHWLDSSVSEDAFLDGTAPLRSRPR
ncbi:hypothetical protein [Nocardioides ultimimeridianus]